MKFFFRPTGDIPLPWHVYVCVYSVGTLVCLVGLYAALYSVFRCVHMFGRHTQKTNGAGVYM